jgi:hypothetical protein
MHPLETWVMLATITALGVIGVALGFFARFFEHRCSLDEQVISLYMYSWAVLICIVDGLLLVGYGIY